MHILRDFVLRLHGLIWGKSTKWDFSNLLVSVHRAYILIEIWAAKLSCLLKLLKLFHKWRKLPVGFVKMFLLYIFYCKILLLMKVSLRWASFQLHYYSKSVQNPVLIDNIKCCPPCLYEPGSVLPDSHIGTRGNYLQSVSIKLGSWKIKRINAQQQTNT